MAHEVIEAVNTGREGGGGAAIGLAVGVAAAIIWSLNQAPAGCQPGDFGFNGVAITFVCLGRGSVVAGFELNKSYPISLAVVGVAGTVFAFAGYVIEGWLRAGRKEG